MPTDTNGPVPSPPNVEAAFQAACDAVPGGMTEVEFVQVAMRMIDQAAERCDRREVQTIEAAVRCMDCCRNADEWVRF